MVASYWAVCAPTRMAVILSTFARTRRLLPQQHTSTRSAVGCAALQAAIASGGSVSKEFDIINVDRSALGRVGGAIARKYGDSGFAGEAKTSDICALGGAKLHMMSAKIVCRHPH